MYNQFYKKMLVINTTIVENIKAESILDYTLILQNVLAQLRNLVEKVALLLYSETTEDQLEDCQDDVRKAIKYCKTKSELNFISIFHTYLNSSTGHCTNGYDGSTRLFEKYYEYLFLIRMLIKEKYNIIILENLENLRKEYDEELKEFYNDVLAKLETLQKGKYEKFQNEKYYVQGNRAIYSKGKIFYEVTLMRITDSSAKGDTIIAYSKKRINTKYCANFNTQNIIVKAFKGEMEVKLIHDYMISIRECEFKNLAKLVGEFELADRISNKHKEYQNIMNYLTTTGLNLFDVVIFDEDDFYYMSNEIGNGAEVLYISELLKISRRIILNNYAGCNILRYLLHVCNNRIIRHQYAIYPNNQLDDLYIKNESIPFDKMPYYFSLVEHNPELNDLYVCIDPHNHIDELLARYVRNNTENNLQLYTSFDELKDFKNVEELAKKYNSRLYIRHYDDNKLVIDRNNIFINSYEKNSKYIIKKLVGMSEKGYDWYEKLAKEWIEKNKERLDSEEKIEKLKNLFSNSMVTTIYGPAGTGKTTIVDYISKIFEKQNKIFLSNTNAAVNNLKRRVYEATDENCMTITKFLSTKIDDTNLLILDECSAISNLDMKKVLSKIRFKAIVLVGDIYQLESIRFGNWFKLLQYFLPKYAVNELTQINRTSNENLKVLWKKIRSYDSDVTEYMVNKEFCTQIDESIFERKAKDEIILCLNYDGLYGINNINEFMQHNNPGKLYRWETYKFKINDPIVFIETERFGKILYNNLKGKILGVEINNNHIDFVIEVYDTINPAEVEWSNTGINIIESKDESTIISFDIVSSKSNYEDEVGKNSIIPFQLSYAVSIHKSQGLEYDSVKVIINDRIQDLITHNIFYTSITRSKQNLKIYWNQDTEDEILKRFKPVEDNKDALILSNKYDFKMHK